jgi:C1A family cysteine protease
MTIQRYGWTPDLPDHRDHVYAMPILAQTTLPPNIDLSSHCPKTVYDQAQLGSCTANAIAAAVEFDLIRQKLKDFMPSRLFIYFNERTMEGTVKEDAGAMIRDGIKSVKKQGVPPEKLWPYSDANPGPFQEKPGAPVYQEALKHQVTSYQRVPRVLRSMKACLASGFPFVFGFSVYEGFESAAVAKTGEVHMPQPNEQLLGGHAVLAIGYDDATQRFLVRNSWGPHWGKHGNFTIPYAYLLDADLSDDFWTVRAIEA